MSAITVVKNATGLFATSATGASMIYVGSLLAQVGVHELVHLGTTFQSMAASSGFLGAAAWLPVAADSLLMSGAGVGITFVGGLAVGIGINDFVLVPVFGGPTFGEGLSHLRGR
jgi:hypothetical protein